jgi:hypothetical protein
MSRELSERIALHISAKAKREIETLAALRGVSVSACIRSMLDHFLADDGGKSAELARIKNIFSRSFRARQASRPPS